MISEVHCWASLCVGGLTGLCLRISRWIRLNSCFSLSCFQSQRIEQLSTVNYCSLVPHLVFFLPSNLIRTFLPALTLQGFKPILSLLSSCHYNNRPKCLLSSLIVTTTLSFYNALFQLDSLYTIINQSTQLMILLLQFCQPLDLANAILKSIKAAVCQPGGASALFYYCLRIKYLRICILVIHFYIYI